MSRISKITDRAMELAGQAGTSLSKISPNAEKLLKTGAALGVAKTGGKVALGFARRNPVVAVAAAVGVGVLAYAANRKRKQAALDAPIEGKSKRVEAKRVNGTGKRASTSTTTARKPRTTAKTRSRPSTQA